jgi:4-amino-4-deoxy-L-arabinose transferase-like glycosyltransferase
VVEPAAAPRGTAWVPILAIAGALVALLLVLSPLYGFHRDELYFVVAGRHPAFGYDDQGPLTPLLSAAAVALLGLSPTAIRILPALSFGACVVLAGLIARDLGGTRRAQVIGAATLAASGFLAAGHLDSTATFDLLAWTVVLWLIVRLLGGADPRWWLGVGLVVGLALENKFLVLFLGAAVVAGILLARRWEIVRSPWAWGGLALAVLLWAPNLWWQAANGFPQLEMAARISDSDARTKLLVELVLLAGPLLFPVSLAGAWWLLRAPAARPWRALGYALPVLLLLVLLVGGKSYYVAGSFALAMGAGGIAVDGWLGRGRRPALRLASFVVAWTASFALVVVLVLPVLPPAAFASSPVADIYAESAEQLGWPELVATVEDVAAGLPAEQLARTAILTDNYGEAGALELLGSGLPPVYSGHNAYGRWGPPPDDRTAAIVITHAPSSAFASYWGLGTCTLEARVDNGLELDNQEQGVGVWVCPQVDGPWTSLWPRIRHLD